MLLLVLLQYREEFACATDSSLQLNRILFDFQTSHRQIWNTMEHYIQYVQSPLATVGQDRSMVRQLRRALAQLSSTRA